MARPKATVSTSEEEQERQAEISEVHKESEENPIDETVPGGRCIVGGITVNSEGEPIK